MTETHTLPAGWTSTSLRALSPRFEPEVVFGPEDRVWNLTLDQIVGATGEIINRETSTFSETGTSRFAFDEQTILYSKLRPSLNKVTWPKACGVASSELVPLKPSPDRMLPGYLIHYLRSPDFINYISDKVAGSALPRVVMDEFWAHEVPHPADIREQAVIVELLDQADTLRRQRARAEAKLAQILPAIFSHYFGDLQTNPRGWVVGELREVVIEVANGLSLSAGSDPRGTPILRVSNIRVDGRLDLEDLKFVESSEDDTRNHFLRNGDLLFSSANSPEQVGKTALWREPFPMVAASTLNVLRINRDRVEPAFLWALMNTPEFRSLVLSRGKRTTSMVRFTSAELLSLPIFLPPLTRQQLFANALEQIETIRGHSSRSAAQLETLFQTLLHRAMTGGLTSKWREAHLVDGAGKIPVV